MSALNMLMSAAGAGGAADKLYVDDVFSTYPYTANGGTQTIVNGIDLAKYGGLVWTKNRTLGSTNHILTDSVSGLDKFLRSNQTVGATSYSANSLTAPAFLGTGFTTSNYSDAGAQSGHGFVSWTFRRAPKFFEPLTFTHTNGTAKTIDLSYLGAVGFVTIKSTDSTSDWYAWHRSLAAGNNLRLNTTAAQSTTDAFISVSGTTLTFSASAPSGTYVLYGWAHDPAEDGIIQCGSYVGTSSEQLINLGRESQFVIIKSVSATDPWLMADTMRGMPISGQFQCIEAQSFATEATYSAAILPDAMGFRVTSSQTTVNAAGSTYIYLAIRRPNKPPTSGTQVYNAIARTSTGTNTVISGVGFPVDLVLSKSRTRALIPAWFSRLVGQGIHLRSSGTDAEYSDPTSLTGFDVQDGVRVGTDTALMESINGNAPASNYINYFFRRAPGFFDVVCDTGTGAAHAIAHNLTKAPELIIRKSRSASTQWDVWHSALAANEKLVLNSVAAKVTDTAAWNSTLPTATQFTVGTGASVNANAATFVTYLFASLPGISKVGTYTGNGSSQNIECGFATGARFILIKRTDSTSDWYVWDVARGILAANDPRLCLNTTAAEVTTDDSVDPYAPGFAVNQNSATSININGASYIFLSIA